MRDMSSYQLIPFPLDRKLPNSIRAKQIPRAQSYNQSSGLMVAETASHILRQ